MAEYYPLLDRAVSGLTDPTAEARRSVYDRARAALVGQLRRMEPPISEEDIARESAALDVAIARVEEGFEGRVATVDPPSGPDATTPLEPAASPPPRTSPPPLPTGKAPPVPPPSRERPAAPSSSQVPAEGPATALASLEGETPSVAAGARRAAPPRSRMVDTPPSRDAASRGTRPIMALRPVPAAADAKGEGGLPPAGRLGADIGPAQTLAPEPATRDAAEHPVRPARTDFADILETAGRPDGDRADAPQADAFALPPTARARDGRSRPPAPRPPQTRRFGWPVAVAALVAVALMIGIGVAAYRLRDRPEQVVGARSAASADAATPGKVVERASPASADPAPEPTSGAVVPSPVPQGLAGDGAAPSIAVAQRAALLVDAPDDPQRLKTFVGTVVWHTDSVSPGGGQPLATAVKADIDIPDAHLKVTMLLQKNPEPQLPASHTIEFHFLPQAGYTLGAIKQVNVPEMRRDDEAQTGDSLSGVPVTITDNYFLVGLSRGGAEAQNVRLMSDRNWFDMSVLFVSGKLGKLTFEKGPAGQRVLDDALKLWK